MTFIQKGTKLNECEHEEFTRQYFPEQDAVYRGIYRCVCGYEMVYDGEGTLSASDKFPNEHPRDHEHLWSLFVSIRKPFKNVTYLEE
jgi:hypothetical protein